MEPLKNLVAVLPQVYQPIYGHPELSGTAIRNCEDRLEQIVAVHDALAHCLQRPVRVLDLGCAQGWFSLSLARKGAQVIGIDYLPANIDLCNGLVAENPGLKVRFALLDIQQLPAQLKADQFDLVLGLNVFHHLCYRNGRKWTRHLLGLIFAAIPVALLEMALACEEGEFGSAQPENPDYLVEQAPFFQVLSHHSRHLLYSRPLYFCSRSFWYLGGTVGAFSTWHDNGYGRRYFFGDELLAKVYRVTDKNGVGHRQAIGREAAFLKAPPEGYDGCPRLLQSEETAEAAWLVREKIPGTMLNERIENGQAYDERAVLLGILRQLAALERAGLSHADVCIWNVVIGPDSSPTLINYKEIAAAKSDSGSKEALFSAFMTFIRQIVTRREFETVPTKGSFINPHNLPEPYRQWVLQLLKRPVAEWSFAFFLETLEALPMETAPGGTGSGTPLSTS